MKYLTVLTGLAIATFTTIPSVAKAATFNGLLATVFGSSWMTKKKNTLST